MFGSLYTLKPEHVKKGQMSSAFIKYNFRSITQVSTTYYHIVNSNMLSCDFGYPYIRLICKVVVTLGLRSLKTTIGFV